MATRKIKYECSSCHREVGKLNLVAKRVQYKEMGKGGAAIKSRVVSWLCRVPQADGQPSCLDMDADWSRPLFSTAPGMKGTSIEEQVVA